MDLTSDGKFDEWYWCIERLQGKRFSTWSAHREFRSPIRAREVEGKRTTEQEGLIV